MKHWLLAGFLLLQEDPTIRRDRYRLYDGSKFAIVTLVAEHADGTPARGWISCDGHWTKHRDEDTTVGGWNLPFTTDARGAIILNPHYYEDEMLNCRAWDKHLHSGESSFSLIESGDVQRIVVR
jgi:hypothetical protein